MSAHIVPSKDDWTTPISGDPNSRMPFRLVVKRLLDCIIASLTIAILAPLLVAIAVAVWVDNPSERVLTRTLAIGRHGQRFYLLRFRTTQVTPTFASASYGSQRRTLDTAVDTTQRVTPFGARLRTYSLDELPQLWNVVRGDLSLVGPRPQSTVSSEPAGVAPGLTGVAQIAMPASVDDARSLDDWYAANWSLRLDALLIARTIEAVVWRARVDGPWREVA